MPSKEPAQHQQPLSMLGRSGEEKGRKRAEGNIRWGKQGSEGRRKEREGRGKERGKGREGKGKGVKKKEGMGKEKEGRGKKRDKKEAERKGT